MTKIVHFALKIKGGGREGGTCEVLRPYHLPKFGTCTNSRINYRFACQGVILNFTSQNLFYVFHGVTTSFNF